MIGVNAKENGLLGGITELSGTNGQENEILLGVGSSGYFPGKLFIVYQ